MKKLYTLLSVVVLAFSATAQNPVLTTVLDGPCTGGLPKLLEIYANGTVDFTQFTLQNQTNGNTTWGASLDLSPLGTRTNEFVYVVYTNANLSVATAEFPNVTTENALESNTINLNGDDRLRIINTATTAVIDQFGVTDVDGSESTWEWLDTYATRNNGTSPNGTFVESDWTIAAINSLDNTGTCTGGAALSTIVTLGGYTLGVKQNSIQGLKVYPNPVTNGTLFIDTTSDATKAVVIYDVLGKQVVNTTTQSAVNVSNLKGGVYIVKITEEGKTVTRKLVIR